jgi:hypothetical protein
MKKVEIHLPNAHVIFDEQSSLVSFTGTDTDEPVDPVTITFEEFSELKTFVDDNFGYGCYKEWITEDQPEDSSA